MTYLRFVRYYVKVTLLVTLQATHKENTVANLEKALTEARDRINDTPSILGGNITGIADSLEIFIDDVEISEEQAAFLAVLVLEMRHFAQFGSKYPESEA